MSDSSNYFSLKVELDYTYSLGALKPYFDALVETRALGSNCPTCGKVNFPPRIVCDNDRTDTEWIELNGTGEIIEFSTGRDANGERVVFALIQMNGASNYCLGRLEERDLQVGDLVQINTSGLESAHPAQRVVFKRISNEHET